MSQANAERTQFDARQLITSAINDDAQIVNDTAFFKLGDTVNIILVDVDGCLVSSVYENVIVSGICPEDKLVFDQAVDTSSPPAGTSFYVENKDLWDVQQAVERLYKCFSEPSDYPFPADPMIIAQELDTPIVGQARYTIDGQVLCFEAGDSIQIICDEGIAYTGTVVSRDIANNKIVLDSSVDLSSFTNCCLVNTSLTLKEVINRLKASESPVCNEELDVGDCKLTAFETNLIFIDGCEAVYLDGSRLRRGTCGTKATLSNGAGNAELILTSQILGIDGNLTNLVLVDPAAPTSPLTVVVTGTYNSGFTITVSLETDGGSAIISTAEDVAVAIDLDAEARRIVLAQFGGDGTGLQAALSSTPLAGGLDDGTGDYCASERLENNIIAGTGYSWILVHIRTNEKNRLHSPPKNDEDLIIDYRKST